MDKVTKKRIKRYLTWISMAAVVVLLTVMPLLAKQEAQKDGPQASILSAEAQTGSITSTLHGGGTLEDEDAQDAVIPTGVKITGFLVKNGDIVQEGTPVATVDKTSVMAAITEVNETLEFLRDELEDSRGEMVDSTITAVPGGRVKKVFAKEGEDVQDVMLRDGALSVISIDSMMAARFAVDSTLGAGENVDMTLADGTIVTGRVESNLDGAVVVTIDDEGYEIGQTVTVEGLGSGTLYIHNAWKVTGHVGTISRVYAEEEQTLAEGANLFSLEDREFEGQLQHRANQHRQYEELLQTLLKMYASGTINAPCAGVVSGVDKDSVHLLSAEGQWQIELLDNDGAAKYQIVFLSGQPSCTGKWDCQATIHTAENHECMNCDKRDICPAKDTEHNSTCIESCTPANNQCSAEKHDADCVFYCNEAEKPEECPNRSNKNHKDKCIHKCNPNAKLESECPGKGFHYSSCIKACDYDAVTHTCPGTGAHKESCIGSCIHAGAENQCKDAAFPHYPDCIESCTISPSANVSCPASNHKTGCFYMGMVYKAYGAIVDQVANGALIVRMNPQEVYSVDKEGSAWKITSGTFNQELLVVPNTVSVGNAKDFKEGDLVLLVTGYKGQNAQWSGVVLYSAAPSKFPDLSGIMGMFGGMDLSGMMGGFAGYGNYSGMTTQETENLHDLEGSALVTVTPHKTMKLAITLDEKDISKVSIGMTADVTVEALKNQTFSGEVTSIGIHGTNNGGSSKYTVDITLQVEGDMLSGMSASASIPLTTKENVLVIPVAALHELDGKTIVYTALDKDSGEPASPVEVVTGVSDGENAEILSGLTAGAQVYYSYYDTLEEDTSAEAEKFTFG